MQWIKNHKLLSVVILFFAGGVGFVALIVFVAIIAAIGSNAPDVQKQAADKNEIVAATQAPTIKPDEQKKFEITKENYDKIQKEMTAAQVREILGDPSRISENESLGAGKMEMWHYQTGFTMKAIDITIMNGNVYSKNWTDL